MPEGISIMVDLILLGNDRPNTTSKYYGFGLRCGK